MFKKTITLELTRSQVQFLQTAVDDQKGYLESELEYIGVDHSDREDFIDELADMSDMEKQLNGKD